MPTDMTHLTCRIPADTRRALEEVAKQKRMETGENVTLTDLVREALQEYVRQQKA